MSKHKPFLKLILSHANENPVARPPSGPAVPEKLSTRFIFLGTWTIWTILMIVLVCAQLGGGAFVGYFLYSQIPEGTTIASIPAVSTSGEFAWISVGQRAFGFVAIGQFAFGFITIGQVTLGFINISMVGIGVLFSIGMGTFSAGPVIAMISASGYTIAGMLSFSLTSCRTVILGVHLLHPFYGDSDSMFACLSCQSSSNVAYVSLDSTVDPDEFISFTNSRSGTFIVNGNPTTTTGSTFTHPTPHYNPATDPFSPFNMNNPSGIYQTNQRMQRQQHQDEMNRMNQQQHQQSIHRMNQHIQQTNMRNHQTHITNMNNHQRHQMNMNMHHRR